ncbi:MAG: divalent metal cation transporter, partial [Verrucomicrobiota bacterium]
MDSDQLAQERAELAEINQKPFFQRFGYYTKKSGPGWLQGAITLGGGSLAGAMYLGVFMGYNMMWIQPLAMILGVVMLSAISYVTLSTGQRPFGAINEHVSPVLGWAWLIAATMANIVWCMPQFALGTAALQQNLGASAVPTWIICSVLLVIAFAVNYSYESGSKGIALFELILKILVGIVVVSFFGVVIALSSSGVLDWAAVFNGLIPNIGLFQNPAPTYNEFIAATGDFASYWTNKINADQRDIMITAFGTAVGINMTFLLPYSMLKKKWGTEHRPLAIVDLSIGLIVPFVLATGCVVIAAASQFHTKYDDVLDESGKVEAAMAKGFNDIADGRIKAELGENAFGLLSQDELAEIRKDRAGASDAEIKAILGGKAIGALSPDELDQVRANLPLADKQMAAMLVRRDNKNLASALEPLTGKTVAQVVFGIGVLGMALSTIIILMLINGFTFCEMFGKPGNRTIHLIGCLVAGIAGFMGPFLWGNANAKAALAIPTSIIGFSMLPIAYFTFLLLMNSKKVLGSNIPKAGSKV